MLVLGGDLAEIVFALGAGDHVVATDDTALWPPDAADLPKVGYLRRLSAEGVLSLAPDLVLASADAGPPAVMEQIRAAGLDVETAPEGQGIAAVLAKIAFVGEVFGLEARAAALAEEVSSGMAALERGLADLPDRPSVLFLMSAGKGPPVAAGTGTAADGMISLAHGRNVVEGFAGYKPLSAEAAVALAPEVVVLPDHAAEAAGGADAVLAAAGIESTPAGVAGRVVVMDGLKLLGFGPRTEAVAELARAASGRRRPARALRWSPWQPCHDGAACRAARCCSWSLP